MKLFPFIYHGNSIKTISYFCYARALQAGDRCKICSSGSISDSVGRIDPFNLNESQKAAVLSCIATAKCHHQNSVELIKGPPGTGKTKTVGSLLCALLEMKCRTLACAPTNIAVLEVAERVLSLVEDSLEYGGYGLGDIVLFGSQEGMQIDEDSDLCDIFLDIRASILAQCFYPNSGWKHCLDSMIRLLEETKLDCVLHLEDRANKHNNGQKKKKHEKGVLGNEKLEISMEKEELQCVKEQKKKHEKVVLGNEKLEISMEKEELQYVKEQKKKHEKGVLGNEKLEISMEKEELQYVKDPKNKKVWKVVVGQTSKGKKKNKEKQDKDELTQNENNRVATGEHHDFLISEEFVKRFDFIGEQLELFTKDLYTHLPTSFISLGVVKDMVRALDFLERLKELHKYQDVGKCADLLPELHSTREEFLQILKCLSKKFTLPKFYTDDKIKKFCLEKACLIFCTASSSVKLKMKGMTPVELLVIDEAAQLKECESTIPLQIPGLRHAILVGDEMQLPALVKSKVLDTIFFFFLFS